MPISARTGEGLDDLLGELSKYAIEGPQLFPEDMVSDQPELQLVCWRSPARRCSVARPRGARTA